jgi:hypothetical protein
MPHIRGVGGKCVCDTRFYLPYGGDGEPHGVVFQGNRLGRFAGRVCPQCEQLLDEYGPCWTGAHNYFGWRKDRDEQEEVECLKLLP